MVKRVKISEEYLYVPIQVEQTEQLLELYIEENINSMTKVMEFMIPVGKAKQSTYPYHYLARFPVKQFTDKTLILKGDVPEAFMEEVVNTSLIEYESLRRPSIHFTAERGWINDPNGLVYKDGSYHLYFQYNPCNTQWNNMCWGHAVSEDLLHWRQMETVMFPDEEGMIFSGSGIVNDHKMLDLPEDALIFFYSAAGGSNAWTKGKNFVQKIAYSLDQGTTLIKTAKEILPNIKQENRDPKVFWHEMSKAYIMTLWLEKHDFAILRSTDLVHWEQSEKLTLEEAWECPDLFPLEDENNNTKWVFWTADGFYYFGNFDGYTFETDGIRHTAYMNKLAYAAQTYSGIKGRIISIPWLRSKQKERLYTGTMGLPRELGLRTIDGVVYLTQNLPKEYYEVRENIDCDVLELQETVVYEMDMRLRVDVKEQYIWNVGGNAVKYDRENGIFSVGEENYNIGKEIIDFSFILDDTIFEVTANHGIIYGAFELDLLHTQITCNMDYFSGIKMYKI